MGRVLMTVLIGLGVFGPFGVSFGAQVQMEKVPYGGWPDCIRVTNGQIEFIATTDVGPRIIRFGFVGGQNIFKEFKEEIGKTGTDEWFSYGGHRLWHSPEAMPRSYWPDNEPVPYEWDGKTLKLMAPVETANCVKKEISLTMDADRNRVNVLHKITNVGAWEIELAPWALTVMAPSGTAILPQEDFRPHPDYLLPARPLVLWHYTQMGDPRWTWGNKYIQLRMDPNATTKQKAGLLNKQGWAAYYLSGDLFIKHIPYDPEATYPDYMCNTETFTNSEMLEVESLGPLKKLAPNGGAVELNEIWTLDKVELKPGEAAIDEQVLPLVQKGK